ncbi:MAG: hypothetical protein IJO43_02685 [Bacilli bacterium]|nr:hypothetical protein [Bacilli bacterium]
MKPAKNIFKWFRKKTTPIDKKSSLEKKVISKQEKISEDKTTKNIPLSPTTPNVPKKEVVCEIPTNKNERETIIKPTRTIGIEPLQEVDKKQKKLDSTLKPEQNKKDDIKIKEDIENYIPSKIYAKDTVENEENYNDISIKTNTLDEIEKMLIINYNEIQTIKYELDILEEKEQDEVILDETEKLIEYLNKLIKRFEQIKKEFYQTNLDKITVHANNDNYISQLIEEYKTTMKDNNLNESVLKNIKQIEEYISLIDDIIFIETKKDDISNRLNSKKETLKIRDQEFDELKDKYTDVEKINNYIGLFSKEYNYIIKEIETKVSNATNITKKAEYKSETAINYARLLTSTLVLATTPAIPFTRGGNILKMGLMIAAVSGISSSIKVRAKESKVTTKINFIDYEEEILSNINSIKDMSLMIDKSMVDIKNIKKEFQKEFSEYANLIPEYYEMMANLDSIEKELLVKYNISREYNQKLNTVLEKNNTKVKRLEEEIPN